MAGITLQCPCGRRMTVGPQHAGRQGRCPSCGRLLQIPAAASMAPAAAPSPTFAGNCAICQTSIAGDEPATRCSACHLPYHEDCWQDYGGCAHYTAVDDGTPVAGSRSLTLNLILTLALILTLTLTPTLT